MSSARAANIVARSGGAFPHHLVIDGRLAGSWTRKVKENSVAIEVAPYFKLIPAQSRAVLSAADCYGDFLGDRCRSRLSRPPLKPDHVLIKSEP